MTRCKCDNNGYSSPCTNRARVSMTDKLAGLCCSVISVCRLRAAVASLHSKPCSLLLPLNDPLILSDTKPIMRQKLAGAQASSSLVPSWREPIRSASHRGRMLGLMSIGKEADSPGLCDRDVCVGHQITMSG